MLACTGRSERVRALLVAIVLPVALLPVCCGSPPEPAVTTEPGVGWVVARSGVPGVSIAVIRDFAIDYLEVHGLRNATTQAPVSVETLFQAGSISKPLAAMAALRFVLEGRIALDDDINLALRSWRVPESDLTAVEKVTLRRLLSHTAGTTVHGFYPYYVDGEPIPTLLQILDGVPPANTPPVVVDTVPGTRYRYSSGGYAIVQLALEDVGGVAFSRLMEDVVLVPVGMWSSTFEQWLPPELATQTSSGHAQDGEPLDRRINPALAAGGLWTTPEDLALFLIEMLLSLRGESNRVLSQPLTQLMTTPALIEDHGLGLALSHVGGETYFGHSGSSWGFQCLMVAHPTGVGAVVMTNSEVGLAVAEDIVAIIGTREGWPGYSQ